MQVKTCCMFLHAYYAIVAQLVERHLAKVEIAGSSPVYRSYERILRYPLFVWAGELSPTRFYAHVPDSISYRAEPWASGCGRAVCPGLFC